MQMLKSKKINWILFFIMILFLSLNYHSLYAQRPGQTTMYVEGRHLHTAGGEQVILRGVNEMAIYSNDPTGSWVFHEIARTGANCVRIIAGNNENVDLSGEDLTSAIQNANNSGMILMAGIWMATCDWSEFQACVDWWLKPEIIAAVQNNEEYFLLNIANEAGATVSDAQYLSGYKSAITQLRDAGYKCPLVIDAASCGQGAEQPLDAYHAFLDHDTLSNIVVSWHTYNHGTKDEIKTIYDTNIAQAVNDTICFIIGEGPTPTSWACSSSPYLYGAEKCQENQIGWLGWSWGLVNNGDCATYDWTADGYYGNWETEAGRMLAVDSEYSIANTSIRPSSLEYLSVSPGVILFDASTSNENIYVNASSDWDITDDQDWIEITPQTGSGSDTVSVAVTENTGLTLRSGTVSITSNGIVNEITIRQVGSGQGAVQTIALSDFDSGTLDPFYSWGAPISIVANPDGTPDDSVALLNQTAHPYNAITSWWEEGDLFTGADSLTVDVYANAGGLIRFHCDNSASGGADFEQNITDVPARTWARYTLKTSSMPVSDYKQFAVLHDKNNLIYFDNFILYKTTASQDPYLIFDPETYPQDSLSAGMEIVDIDEEKYLQVVVDQWEQSVTLMDSVLIPLGVSELNFEIKYAIGNSGISISNAWYKYLFKTASDGDLFNAEGDANTITNITEVTTTCNNNVSASNGLYIGSFVVAAQNKNGWTALTGDTLWIGKTTFVDPTVDVIDEIRTPISFHLSQNYPNPFNPTTSIQFNLDAPSQVSLTIYNTLGKNIATLVNKRLSSGSYLYEFDGSELASGIYFYRLETDKAISQKKMILLK